MMISGANFQPPNTQGNHFAYLSRIPHIWGWATWRRAWQNYDFNLNELPAALLSNKWKTFHQDMEICYYWFRIFIQCWLRKIDTRDYQWVFAIMNNKGLCIAPGINLVRNIGINENSTHTKGGFAPNIPDEFYIQIVSFEADEFYIIQISSTSFLSSLFKSDIKFYAYV